VDGELLQRFVRFVDLQDSDTRQVVVEEWVDGTKVSININNHTTFDKFQRDVSDAFAQESPRIYVLVSPGFRWSERIKMDSTLFADYVARDGPFCRPKALKLFVWSGENSPDCSPGMKKMVDGACSEVSTQSARTGQSDFRNRVLWRDGNRCVFCDFAGEPLEAAHVLPYDDRVTAEKDFLLYGICGIMETINGLTLCWNCHRAYDANLVCIDPSTNELRVADALLANEQDKWEPLNNRAIDAAAKQWPTKELLQYREEAMKQQTAKRHLDQSKYLFSCEICGKGYKSTAWLQKHENQCTSPAKSMSNYRTPQKGTGLVEAAVDFDENF